MPRDRERLNTWRRANYLQHRERFLAEKKLYHLAHGEEKRAYAKNAKQRARNLKDPTYNRAQSKRHRDERRELLIALKNRPCEDCGVQYPRYILDFDHVRGTKIFNLKLSCTRFRSINAIIAEVEKCDLVCANCHRERHHQRHSAKRLAQTELIESAAPSQTEHTRLQLCEQKNDQAA